jgi:hypothetical protein
MSKVIVDETLRAHLPDLAEQLEFCDEHGKTLGHFLPESVYQAFVRSWMEANISEDELQRRRAEPRGRTLAEIWKSLGQP